MGKYARTFALQVGTQPKQLVAKDEKRTTFLVYNNGSVTVYILSAQTMTAADGMPVIAGASYENDSSTAAFWIIAASGTQDVRVEVTGD